MTEAPLFVPGLAIGVAVSQIWDGGEINIAASHSSGSEPLKLLNEGGLRSPGIDRLMLAKRVDYRRVQYRSARLAGKF
jgi:hypothetical protein